MLSKPLSETTNEADSIKHVMSGFFPSLHPLWLIGLSLISLSIMGFQAQAGEAARPNILFIFSDDQRADTIAALGNDQVQTPNLDRLVKQGTAFTRAYCMGGLNAAVCVPSRAMLMSGRSLFRVKEDLSDQTWPEKFTAAGYRTFAAGKWHNGAKSLKQSFSQGGALFIKGMGNPNNMALQWLIDGQLANTPPSGAVPKGHAVELFADAAVAFIKEQTAAKPFLCYVAFTSPHDPRIAPPEFHALYRKNLPPAPKNFLPVHPFDNGEMTIRDEKLLPKPRTEQAVRGEIADYYAAITHMDQQIGRILAALESSGQADNTIIVFSSDHGLAIGSHGLMGKQNLYEHSMRSPLIMVGPGIPAGKRTSALCHLYDIYPTLGELAGVAAPTESEGRSLRPALIDQAATIRPVIGTAYRNVQRAITDGRWKLIAYPKVPRVQLFDLEKDPDEMHDLAGDAAHRERLSEMVAALVAWQRDNGDSLPAITMPSVP